MAKYFERDQLVEHLTRMMGARQIERLPRSGYAKAIQDVDGCPAADVVPVTRGRWILHDDELFPWVECSECGWSLGNAEKFCAGCGAKMDGEEEDG